MRSAIRRSLKITSIYALFGFFWITASDQLMAALVQDSSQISRISMYKGWFYVLVTALLVYFLSKRALEKQATLTEEATISEKRFKAVIETTGTGYLIINDRFRVLYANQIYSLMVGAKTFYELMGRSVLEWTAAYDRERHEAGLNLCLREGRVCNLCVDYELSDGAILPVEVNAVTTETQGGTVIIALCRDISERRIAEDERVGIIEFLRMINESRGTSQLLSSAATFFKRHSGCDAVGIRIKEGDSYPYVETRGFPIEFLERERELWRRDSHGQLINCICGWLLFGGREDIKSFCAEQGSFWTNSMTQFLRERATDECNITMRNICDECGYESVALLPLVSGKERLGLIQLNDRRKGVFSNKRISYYERLAGYLGVALAKSLAEDALRKAEERYFSLYQGIGDGFCFFSIDGGIIEHNKAFVEMLGYDAEELKKLNIQDITPEKWRSHEKKIFETQLLSRGYSDVYTIEYLKKGGIPIPVEVRAFLVKDEDENLAGVWKIVRDITERKKAEEEKLALENQLLQSQKMEAIGKLAGGVAHDFNNFINAIIGYCALIQMKIKPDDPAANYLREIVAASERAAALTKSLLAFSRKQIINVKPLNLNDSVRSVAKLCNNFLGEDLKLELDLEEKDIVVAADSGQIDQVIMNLATNARDAMPNGGTLTISTRIETIDSEFIRKRGFGSEGRYAELSVKDTGCGISEEVKDKIFEPFFTTKDVGKGTGLGLSIVYGIVSQHNGFIDVESRINEGTTVRVYLPMVDIKVEKSDLLDYIPVKGGSEVILLVEDEKVLRSVIKKTLEEFGYKVIEAEDGEDAVKKFMEHRDEIAITLMDVIMPNKNGGDAYQEIFAIRNDAKVIFMSGYANEQIFAKIANTGCELIQKPFSPRELLKKIRNALDAKTSDSLKN